MKKIEFVTRCDTCGRIIRSERATRQQEQDRPVIMVVGVTIPGTDKTFYDSHNYGDMCKSCYDNIVLPMIKELQESSNVHVTIKNALR